MLVIKLDDCKEITAGDKTQLRETLHPNKDGVTVPFSVAHAKVKVGGSSIKHKMKTTEVYYILSGSGIMHIDNETHIVTKNDTIYIPPMLTQYIENTGNEDLVFLCIVDPPWRKEDEIV